MTTSRSEPVMLRCGHVSNAVRTASNGVKHDPVPCCAICDCTDQEPNQINLEGRTARCCSKKTDKPSSFNLAFFEFRGVNSRVALISCKNCGYHKVAHEKKLNGETKNKSICDRFQPHGAFDTDRYYCGCRGWD